MAMQDWEAAITAQFMRTLAYRKEGKAANELLPQLRKRKSAKLIIKVRAG
jgi:hypothetical protein